MDELPYSGDAYGSDGPAAPEYRDSYTPEFRPIGGVWYFRINATGEIAEVNVRVMSAVDWEEGREKADPSWRPIRFGELVVTVKAICD